DCLYLLRVPTLEVLDQVAVPYDPKRHHDGPDVGWRELQVFANPATEHVAFVRNAGDSYMSVSFLRARRGRIGDLHHVDVDDPQFDTVPIHELAFAPSGKRFAGFDRDGCIYEWMWPECRIENSGWDHQLRQEEEDWSIWSRSPTLGISC